MRGLFVINIHYTIALIPIDNFVRNSWVTRVDGKPYADQFCCRMLPKNYRGL